MAVAVAVADPTVSRFLGSQRIVVLKPPKERNPSLIQESIGDPVLTNPGSELLAVTTGAAQVGAVLVPIAGVKSVEEAVGQSGITQYHVSDAGPFDIHGFAAKNTPAGLAARAQIMSFVQSVWAGAPVVKVPAGCKGGSCDFTGK